MLTIVKSNGMVVLGLGSNVGNRQGYLRAALSRLSAGPDPLLSQVRVSLLYESDALLKPGSPPEWDRPFINIAVVGESGYPPRALLKAIKQIEIQIGREPRGLWAPREIDIDILDWNGIVLEDVDLQIPHPGLLERPFALLPYCDVVREPQYELRNKAFGWRVDAYSRWSRSTLPARTRVMSNFENRRFFSEVSAFGVLPARSACNPELVGVVNVTPDSFSDGGKYSDEQAALAQICRLIDSGATIIDIGAESTRPGADPVTEDDEWRRLEPILEGLSDAQRNRARICIDSRRCAVIQRALEFGVDWCNDVSGLEDEEYLQQIAASDCDVVVMHSLGVPPSADRTLSIDERSIELMGDWMSERIYRLNQQGVPSQRIIIDPGIGFGKSALQSFELLRDIARLVSSEVRILVGHSRKSFLTPVTDEEFPDRDLETALLTAHLASAGVDYIRVHNVKDNTRALKTRLGLL